MPIDTFEDHYSTAKKHALDAIQHNQNVVLWGTGSNGKSTLRDELSDLLSNYNVLYEGDPFLVPSDKLFWLECIHSNYPIINLKNQSYSFINMNGFIYPKRHDECVYHSKLRSGKDCF